MEKGVAQKMRIESLLYTKLPSGKVQCQVCLRRCIIEEGKRGFCKTRINEKGRLYSLIYGEVSSFHRAPIEIKPLFHFFPGSFAASFGSLGCNFFCPGCQNWSIAHRDPEAGIKNGETTFFSPEEIIELALKNRCQGISFTYNEPTLWLEFTLDCFRLAKSKGLYTNYVTNGSITMEALKLLGPYLDSFRVDIKGFSSETYYKIAKIKNWKEILKVTQQAKEKWGMHVEVVTNIIPTINDRKEELKEIARWIKEHLGEETPWHITRFYPHFKLSHLYPTPVEFLTEVYQIGKEVGLKFVYLGNVPGHPYENTYCPNCGKLVIRRSNFSIQEYHLKDGRCLFCKHPIPIKGRFSPEK